MFHDAYQLVSHNVFSDRYRLWDFKRSINGAAVVLADSDHVVRQVRRLAPEASNKVHVAYLGPGQFVNGVHASRSRGLTLLVGAAPHKRNELAIEALARSRPRWCQRIVGLSVSQNVQRRAEEVFGVEQCEWRENLSAADVTRLYRSAEVYVSLSMEEGFGLPFLEALTADCNVIAIRQPLTEELLGHAATLVLDGTADRIAAQFSNISDWPSPEDRDAQASRYSWQGTAIAIQKALLSAVGTKDFSTHLH